MLKRIEEAITPIRNSSVHQEADTSTISKTINSNTNVIKEKVNKAITESPNLIAALESIGAMYGIPPSHIISDDTATSIRVVDDNIIAPPIKNPKNQAKPIVQAVGSVLDFISQRIDDKLNDYQMNNIIQGRISDSISNADPSKGKCIGRFEDNEGGEIIAYDTGIVDMPCTPAARAKLEELRANNAIPNEVNFSKLREREQLSYFNDEDDISKDIDMNASSNTVAGQVSAEENDVASEIQESAYHIRMISKFNNTKHLGYDMLRKHGFDFVKPIDSFIQESDDSESKSKKDKSIAPDEIKHMKFDNTEILKAVKFFNKARDAQSNVKNDKMDLDKFINDPNYEKAIDALNKQFNCRINLRFFKNSRGNAATWVMNDIKKNLTISKSKGFQLNGLPIDIIIYDHYLETSSPNEQELFGQNTVSTICHEIFHNIACVLRDENAKMSMSLTMAIQVAANAKTAKERRIIITNYVDSLEEMHGNKFINKVMKKKLVKQLTVLASVSDNEKIVRDMKKTSKKTKESSDEYIKKVIKAYKKALRDVGGAQRNRKYHYIFPVFASAATIVISALTPGMFPVMLSGCGLLSLTIGMGLAEYALGKEYNNSRFYEEYYCDLFASMYKLPKFFFIGPSNKKYVSNDFETDKIDELAKIEKDLFEAIQAKYPSDLERTHAGVTNAKKLLEQKDLDPAIKKYCQWIVDNFSNVHDTEIKTLYNKTTFDPKEAEDLDKHLEDLINDNNIVLTESFIEWMHSDDYIFN